MGMTPVPVLSADVDSEKDVTTLVLQHSQVWSRALRRGVVAAGTMVDCQGPLHAGWVTISGSPSL